ncbi:perlucin-like [Saccoglossus kowalevskii]
MIRINANRSKVWVILLSVLIHFMVDASVFHSIETLNNPTVKRSKGWGTVLCNCVDYKIYTKKVRYSTARYNCADDGGVLAYIPDNATHNVINSNIRGTAAEISKGYWIGLNDIDVKFQYLWETGDKLVKGCDFTNWGRGAPNHKTSKTGAIQSCVQIRPGDGYKWDDDYCHAKKPYVCMFNVCSENQENCSACMGI